MLVGAIFLLVAALACVAAELFFPSHGVLALVAVVLALGSILIAMRVGTAVGVVFALMVLILGPLVLWLAVRIYPQTPMGRRVILRAPPERKRLSTEPGRDALVGQQGRAATVLRPAGIVEIAGERISCVSEAEVIEAGAPVEVIRVSGPRVVVKRI